jgi:hypothetical protein
MPPHAQDLCSVMYTCSNILSQPCHPWADPRDLQGHTTPPLSVHGNKCCLCPHLQLPPRRGLPSQGSCGHRCHRRSHQTGCALSALSSWQHTPGFSCLQKARSRCKPGIVMAIAQSCSQSGRQQTATFGMSVRLQFVGDAHPDGEHRHNALCCPAT